MDWTPEQCLEAALEQVKWMRTHHPEGLEGVAVLFRYSYDYEGATRDGRTKARFFLNSGVDTMEFIALCTRASHMRMSATYGNYSAE